MIGLVGALVALAVLGGIVLVLAVRPPARRLARAVAVSRADLAARLDRLRALRRARPTAEPIGTDDPELVTPTGAAVSASSIGGHGRHRRVDRSP
jgi:hypothetical protein